MVVESQYSSVLTRSNEMYCPSGGCPSSLYHYETIQLNVFTTESYDILCYSNINIDIKVYNNTFDPNFPYFNLLNANSRFGSNCVIGTRIYLYALTQYILVVTTRDANVIGPFAITAVGLTSVNFTRMNTSSKTSIQFTVCFKQTKFSTDYSNNFRKTISAQLLK